MVRVVMSIAFSMFVMAAWGNPAWAQQERKKIAVCSTTQVADFTRQVAGDRWEVRCVLAPGQDPHIYQVTTRDAKWVSEADLCLENGWELEGKHWMKTLAENSGKPLVTCVSGVKPLELEEEGEVIRDPHAWFSPHNAAIYVQNVVKGLSQIDPDNAAEYEARARLYLYQLNGLHGWIQQQVNAIPAAQRKLVTHHDAFGYFCQQYGFEHFSPAGWSTGSEIGGGITTQRRQEAIDAVRKFGVKAIFVETSIDQGRIIQMAKEAGVSIGGKLYSDSMGAPGSAGETYIGMMRENVLTIVRGLK